jgi:hypothetical protein
MSSILNHITSIFTSTFTTTTNNENTIITSNNDNISNYYPLIIKIVFIISTPFIIFRIVWMIMDRIARRHTIMVKRVQRKLEMIQHPLELNVTFVEQMEHDRLLPSACRVQSIPQYLLSLDFKRDDVTAKSIMSTLLGALGGNNFMPLAAMIPAISAHPGLLARFSVQEFPSVLMLAAVVDGATQVMAMVANPDENVVKQSPLPDSMDLLWFGEPPKIIPQLPFIVRGETSNTSLMTDLKHYFISLSDPTIIDLGPEPMVKHYHTPKPFSPDLLPGLCLGFGGLTPGGSPYESVRHRALAMICNCLASNGLHWSEFSPKVTIPEAGLSDQSYYPPTAIMVAGVKVETPAELIDTLIKHGGPKARLTCHVRTNLTAFGISFCVLEEGAPIPTAPTSTDPSSRFNYTQLPLMFCTRTGLTCPKDGDPLKQLSSHSSVEWIFTDNELLGPGTVGVTFYTGVEGFTGFHPWGEWQRPWVLPNDVKRSLSVAEAIRAADLAAAQAVAWNVCVRLWKFPLGGYGGLGVCADSVANIEMALHGQTKIFPLMMRSDAKSALISVIHTEVAPMLLSSGNVKANAMGRILNLACEALIKLPNDVQVLPLEMLHALDRFSACTMDSPFCSDAEERGRFNEVKNGWKAVLEYFTHTTNNKNNRYTQVQQILPQFNNMSPSPSSSLPVSTTSGGGNNVNHNNIPPAGVTRVNSAWRMKQ